MAVGHGEPGSPPKPDRAPDALVDDLLAMFERAPDRLAQAPSEPCLTPAPRPPVAEAQAAEGGEPHAEPFVDEHFVQWLALALQTRRLILNDAKALLHTVADTLFWSALGCSSAMPKSTRTSPCRLSRSSWRTGNGCKSALRNCACTASSLMA